jgi:hypothetical protein
MFVQADYGDYPAIALYETFGKKEPAQQFDIEVHPVPKGAQTKS